MRKQKYKAISLQACWRGVALTARRACRSGRVSACPRSLGAGEDAPFGEVSEGDREASPSGERQASHWACRSVEGLFESLLAEAFPL